MEIFQNKSDDVIVPLVSICCVAYNHENFINDAIESFLMQKTDFPVEILIHDDASTDRTAEIIRKYQSEYPDIIKPVFQTENQFSRGISISKTFNFPRVKGKYVAMCEGDDYWTDPYKLQKQVDYLEEHTDCSMCFHPVYIRWEDGSRPDELFPEPDYRFNKEILKLEDLFIRNFIQTNSVVYRWRFNDNERIDDLYPDNILPGDYFIHLLHAEKGDIGFINETMGIYRRHSGGIWYGNDDYDFWLKNGIRHAAFYQAVEKHFKVLLERPRNEVTFQFIKSGLNRKNFNKISEFINIYPDLYEIFCRNELADRSNELIDTKKKLEDTIEKLEDVKNQLKLLKDSRTWRLRNRIVSLMNCLMPENSIRRKLVFFILRKI